MRIVIQRAKGASVMIEGRKHADFQGLGYVILLGIEATDTPDDVEWLVRKVASLRVFDDENGVMNRSITDIAGEHEGADGNIIVVSQFTLFASYKKGSRPSWLRAATHDISVPLYELFIQRLSDAIGRPVGHGEFGADMKVSLTNDGPVTILMDTHNKE
ncbi:MAG: D-tyrosyl-tRNA(Tyr) deacylase [Bacteroidaceae bacterium]|nr:D-tyrosyl-tRNA(Tyr) deacylase [Bacteroidaceae bacterium]